MYFSIYFTIRTPYINAVFVGYSTQSFSVQLWLSWNSAEQLCTQRWHNVVSFILLLVCPRPVCIVALTSTFLPLRYWEGTQGFAYARQGLRFRAACLGSTSFLYVVKNSVFGWVMFSLSGL